MSRGSRRIALLALPSCAAPPTTTRVRRRHPEPVGTSMDDRESQADPHGQGATTSRTPCGSASDAFGDRLRRHQDEHGGTARTSGRQVLERLSSRVWAGETLVFSTGIGTPLEPRNVLRSFHTLCDRAQVRRVRIHDLLRQVTARAEP